MFVLIGYVVVLASVIGGFVMAGGHVAALLQPLELLMIGGAAGGAFIVGNTPKALKATMKALKTCFASSKYDQALYMELLALLYEILTKTRKEGMMSVESDVDNPYESPLFTKYENIVKDHHVIDFICDYLRLMVGGTLNPIELDNLMTTDIETHHMEGEIPVNSVTKLGDGMPAFGIVAAVMGVVHTMESVGSVSTQELGLLVAHALVGTFLGILLAYGFVGPLATLLEQKLNESTKMFECIKFTLLASLNGYGPPTAVEFGRKILYSTERPTFLELETHVKNSVKK